MGSGGRISNFVCWFFIFFSPTSFRLQSPSKPKLVTKKMVQDNDYRRLVNLGLSVLEARVYLAFVEHGKTSLAVIAKQLNLNQSDLCRVIFRLEELDLIKNACRAPEQLELGLMNDFSADSGVPVIDGNLLERIPFDSFLKLRKKALNTKNFRDAFQCYLFSDLDLCGCEMKRIVEAAQVSCDCIVPAEVFKFNLQFMVDVFGNAVERGVRFRFVLTGASRADAFNVGAPLFLSPFFEFSWVEDCAVDCLIVVDNREVFISTETGKAGRVSFVWSMVPGFVEIGRGCFSKHLR